MKGIYKITSPTNKIYIGQSTNCEKRKRDYRTLNCKGQPKLYRSLKKYGWEKHTFEVLETTNNINEREIYWIDYYDSVNEGLNCCYGGEGSGKPNEETKSKISESMKGKNDWSIGGYTKKPIFQYTKEGKLVKEHTHAPTNVSNISPAARGKLKSAGGFIWIYVEDFTPELLNERINKCKTNNNLGKSKSASHRTNIGRAKKNAYKSGKKIGQYSLDGVLIKEWDRIKDASDNLNLNKSGICNVLKGNYKSSGGFLWEYL